MPAQHHIIKETTDTLVDLFDTTYKDNGYKRVHIIVEAPKPDAIEGKLPAVCLYLYQITPEWDGRPGDTYEGKRTFRTAEGKVIEVREKAPNWVRLDYLVSTFAQTPEDEQLLLGLAVKTVSDTNSLDGDALKGDSFPKEDFYLPISTAGRLEEGTLARFWGSLNQPIRPAIQLWTVIPILSDVVTPFKRVEERVIGYRRLGQRGGDEIELGPERSPDMPPEGVFVERKT